MDALESSQPSQGEVFTRRWVVDVMLDLVGYTADSDLAALRLVEPACGTGAFLIPVVERLVASLPGGNLDDVRLDDAIRAGDVREDNVRHCREAVAAVLRNAGASTSRAESLATRWVRIEDYLLSSRADADLFDVGEPADIVVGNPPYVRLEDMGEEICAAYRSRWPTMSGRADIYVGFLERALRSLRDGGKLAFICPDRWMRNQYGGALRRLVTAGFSVDAVWTMHDVDAFESIVSAYPAITVISRGKQGCAVVADTTEEFTEDSSGELAAWTRLSGLTSAAGRGYRAYRLPHWFPGEEMWPSGSPERLALIEHLNDHFPVLHDPENGTRVGIGIATGADRVYVTDTPDLVEPSRLLRLAMVADIRSGTFRWGGKYLVNPWEPDGSAVRLNAYPRLEEYLTGHASTLCNRHTAKAHPSTWYRTIDRVNNDLINRPKLLIQDMRTSINPVLDPGGHYPHHNLYYVVSETWDMEVLGGLLLSRVAQAFIEAYCVRMRGNTLRFQSQYLKKIRIPDPSAIDDAMRDRLRTAFRERDVEAATNAALDAYKLDRDALGSG